MFKKLVSLFLTAFVLLSFNSFVFAEEEGSSDEHIVTLSEYDLLEPYLDKSFDELLDMGLSDEEANNILEIESNIISQLKEYSSLEAKQLEDKGFSDQQINAIKEEIPSILESNEIDKSRSSDEDISLIKRMPRSSWADLKLTCSYIGKRSSDKYAFEYTWSWSGRPFVEMTDTVSFAWDNGFRVSSGDLGGTVRYCDIQDHTLQVSLLERDDIEISPGQGFRAKFKMSGPNSTFAKNGYGNFLLTNPNKKKSIQMVWAYGHSTYSFGGFCLNVGYPSISINNGAEKMCEGDRVFSL